MIQAILMLMSLALGYVAMTGLSMAMPRHYAQVSTSKLSATQIRWLRIAAWLVLFLSYLPMVKVWGATTGLAVWLGLLSVPCILLMLLLTYRPRFGVQLATGLMALSTVAYALLWVQYPLQ